MDHHSSSSRVYVDSSNHPVDLSRSWSSSSRPTVNTSFPHPTQSDLSPHISSMPPSAHPSPWSHNLHLNSGHHYLPSDLTPRNSLPTLSAEMQTHSGANWDSLFASAPNTGSYGSFPVNPSILPISSSPSVTSLTPANIYNNSYQNQAPKIVHVPQTRHSGSWSQSQSPSSYKFPSGYPPKQSFSHTNTPSSELKMGRMS